MDNVLFLLVDQWPAWAFGFRGAEFSTPNLDRLAAQGTVFRNAFTTCPLCTPARAALLTSRYPHQTGVWDNHSVGYSLQGSLPLAERTWVDEAVGQGYHVGYFGKWHLGANNPERRGAHGFDPAVEINTGPYDPATSTYSYERMRARDAAQSRRLVRGRAPFWGETPTAKEETLPFPVMAKGIDFLGEWAAGERDKPFFLTLSSGQPHFPHHLPVDYARIADRLRATVKLPPSLADDCVGKPWFHAVPWWPCMDTATLDLEEWRTVVAYSNAHIMLVDEAIGRILDVLDRLDLSSSTTVVFTADHGDMAGAHRRFDKGPYFYEEVWRIPLVVRQPGHAPATQNAFVSILDVGETLFRLVGSGAGDERPRSGRDLLPLIGTAEESGEWPPVVHGIYDRYNGMSFVVRAIRDDRWKYVWNPQAIDELYDLADDPSEQRNLAAEPAHAATRDRLRAALLAWLRHIGDPLPCNSSALPPAGTIIATGRLGP